MQVEGLDKILECFPLLVGMKPEHMKLLAGCAENKRYEQGQFLFREGDEANHFFLIRHGCVILEVRGPNHAIAIETVGEGEVVGWSWLIPPYQFRFDARALEMTRVVALDGPCLRAKCEADPVLGYELVKRFSGVLAGRLEATRFRLVDMYGKPEGKKWR